FSTSSLTTEAGRSTTSPAAIWLATCSSSRRMIPNAFPPSSGWRDMRQRTGPDGRGTPFSPPVRPSRILFPAVSARRGQCQLHRVAFGVPAKFGRPFRQRPDVEGADSVLHVKAFVIDAKRQGLAVPRQAHRPGSRVVPDSGAEHRRGEVSV